MEIKQNSAYLKARRKVELLKGFYGHLTVYILVNIAIILVSSNIFGRGKTDFFHWGSYVPAFFWGIGLLFHGVYVFLTLYFKNNVLRRWEERKIKQFLEEDKF